MSDVRESVFKIGDLCTTIDQDEVIINGKSYDVLNKGEKITISDVYYDDDVNTFVYQSNLEDGSIGDDNFEEELISLDRINIQEEKEVLALIVDVWNKFCTLDRQHPCEGNDFADGIHTLQQIIGMRILRKEHPEIFPIKKDK